MRPYGGSIGQKFILMDDNVRPHHAHVTNAYLEHEIILHMDWPAWSLDLNPIEHAWDILQRMISARHVQPRTLQELWYNGCWMEAEWIRIQTLIMSMRRRCCALIDACGCHTRYTGKQVFNNELKTMWKFSLLESPVLRQIWGVPRCSL